MNNSYRQSFYVGLVRITANVLMLGAVFWAMFQASRVSSWPSEAVFCLWFFGITVPVWVVAFCLTRRVRRWFPVESKTALIPLPREGQ